MKSEIRAWNIYSEKVSGAISKQIKQVSNKELRKIEPHNRDSFKLKRFD